METTRRASRIVGAQHSSRWGHNERSHVLPLDSELSVRSSLAWSPGTVTAPSMRKAGL